MSLRCPTRLGSRRCRRRSTSLAVRLCTACRWSLDRALASESA